MNPTRKTATNWLSAIGYRLIMVALISHFYVGFSWAGTKLNISGCVATKEYVSLDSYVCGQNGAVRVRTRIPIGKLLKPKPYEFGLELRCSNSDDTCIETTYYEVGNDRKMCSQNTNNDLLLVSKNDGVKLQKQILNLQTQCSISEQAKEDSRRSSEAQERQARQMCEAQKQTCHASCPAYNYNTSSFDANRTHFQCESRCSQISCN